jgi:acetolactate synthase small subunit
MKLFKILGFNKPELTTIIVDDTNVSTMEMVKSVKKYPIEVQQIHHEFHSAADNLLLEAKSIIEESIR